MSGESNEPGGNRSCREQLIERITVLVGEIETLSQRPDQVPSALLAEMHAMLENARRILESCGQRARDAGEDGDPQPDIDRDILERMYRALGTGPQKR